MSDPLVGSIWVPASAAPSSALDIVLGDHRHAGPLAVTPRAVRRRRWLGPPLRPPPIHLRRLRHAARQRSAPRAAARPKPPPPRRAPCLLAKSFRRAPPPHLACSPPVASAPTSFVVGARRKLLAQARRPPRRLAVVVRAGRRTAGYNRHDKMRWVSLYSTAGCDHSAVFQSTSLESGGLGLFGNQCRGIIRGG